MSEFSEKNVKKANQEEEKLWPASTKANIIAESAVGAAEEVVPGTTTITIIATIATTSISIIRVS